jgi:protocatechuate 3,4-dioxygenase, alpha subunit
VSRLGTTPSQTVGPYLALALRWDDGPLVVPDGTPGSFWLRGRVLDGEGAVVTDALVETWQADVDGTWPHPDDPRWTGTPVTPGFRGFGRSETLDGEYAVHTVRPGARDGAPHLQVSVFARGLLDRVVTRVYLPGPGGKVGTDPVRDALDPARAATLVATPSADGYRFDVRLSGDGETVFFDV